MAFQHIQDLGNDKAIQIDIQGSRLAPESTQVGSKPQALREPKHVSRFSSIPSMRPEERSIMSIQVKNNSELWAALTETLNKMDNTDVQFQEGQKRVLGNHYQYGKNCHFLCALFQLESKENDNEQVLDFRRLAGNGFTMDNFYQNVRSECSKKGLMDANEMESDDDEDGFEFSDEESTDNQNLFFLTPNAYLQLSFDPEVVTSWVKKISPEANSFIEETDHVLGLMAYNVENEENLKIIAETGGHELIEALKHKLQSKKDAFTDAAIVRNSSVIVRIFANNNLLDVSDTKLIESIVWAMKDWSPESRKGKWMSLNVSKETVSSLADALWCLYENGADENYIKQLLAGAPPSMSTFLKPTHTNLENAQKFRQHFL